VHDDRIVRLAVEGDHLALTTPFLPGVKLLPTSDTTFVSRQDSTTYTFSKAAEGLRIQITPPPGDWPFAKRVGDTVTVPLDDAAAGRIEQAAERYRAARAKDPKNFSFSEERLTGVGLRAMAAGDARGAIPLLRVNVLAAPDSTNAYDSLGEAYLRAGDKAQAIAAYQQALATLARDKTTSASVKEDLRKNALAKLKELGAAP
jgi:hypothetical protein